MLYYSNFLIAMFVAIMLIPPLTFAFNKLQIFDVPSERKVHTTPIPRVGGIAIVVATITPLFFWLDWDFGLLGLLSGILVLFIVGVFDDIKDISYKVKFAGQILAIFLVLQLGFIQTEHAYFVSQMAMPNFAVILLYLFFFLGVTNAVNLADGLDGLAGGQALLSFSVISLLAYESNNEDIVIISLAVMGAIFGFLRFNSYPAKIFMGDTGSLFLGFLLGLISVALTYSENSAYAKVLPLLLVGLPMVDTMLVILVRLGNRQSPFSADRNHTHHRLLDKGLKHYQSVLVIYVIQSIFVLSAYFLRYQLELNVLIAFLLISTLALSIILAPWQIVLESGIVNFIRNNVIAKIHTQIRKSHDELFFLLSVILILFCLMASVVSKPLETDMMVLFSIICIAGVLFFISRKNLRFNALERVIMHMMIVLSIYNNFKFNEIDTWYLDKIQVGAIVACFLLSSMLIFSRSMKKFSGSPMDYLLIAIALTVPNLPGSPVANPLLGYLAAKLIALFYCIEFVLFNLDKRWWLARMMMILCAGIPLFTSILS